MTQHLSEVARLRQQINEEYTAAQRGLNGIAITARHDFINARMEQVGQLQKQLAKLVGPLESLQIVHESSLEVLEKQPIKVAKEECHVVG